MTPKVVIVGSGRSGSGYIAAVLREAGIRCGHEAWWNPTGEREEGLEADSSWCALALGLKDFDGLVVHQVRHPLDVISSLVKAPPFEPYTSLMCALIRRRLLFVPANIVEFAMATWVAYNRAAQEIAAEGWPVEELPPDVIRRIADSAGANVVSEADARRAIASVPTTFNEHGPGTRLEWSELPAGALRNAVEADAWEYGYR